MPTAPPIPTGPVTDPTKLNTAYKQGQGDIANLYMKSLAYDKLPQEKVSGGLTALQQLLEVKKPITPDRFNLGPEQTRFELTRLTGKGL